MFIPRKKLDLAFDFVLLGILNFKYFSRVFPAILLFFYGAPTKGFLGRRIFYFSIL